MVSRGIDFNLLVPMRVLLEERNVSRAAERLHMSQSSLSVSLAKLRAHFGDPLLVRRGNRYELTPLAVLLLDRSHSAVHGVEQIFATRAAFAPEAVTREFSIVISDFGTAIFGANLSREISRVAPAARVRFINISPEIVSTAPDGLRNYDGLVIPHGFFATNHIDLLEDRWVCLASATNSRVRDHLTMQDLSIFPWVSTHNGPADFSPAFTQMQVLGVEPRIEAVTQNFLTLPAMLHDTERLATVQASLARELVATGLVRALECPFDVAPLREAFWWHPVHEFDPEHSWLRSIVAEVASEASG